MGISTVAAIVLSALIVALGTQCSSNLDRSRSELYFGFTRLDPGTEAVVPDAYLIVSDGRIDEVGQGTPPPGSYRERHDLTGRFALPGWRPGGRRNSACATSSSTSRSARRN